MFRLPFATPRRHQTRAEYERVRRFLARFEQYWIKLKLSRDTIHYSAINKPVIQKHSPAIELVTANPPGFSQLETSIISMIFLPAMFPRNDPTGRSNDQRPVQSCLRFAKAVCWSRTDAVQPCLYGHLAEVFGPDYQWLKTAGLFGQKKESMGPKNLEKSEELLGGVKNIF